MHVYVVGAGVVGLCVAVSLQREGYQVTLLDPLPPPGGASFGNAGMISSDSFMPQAQPGMLGRIPKWLINPLGPLAINPIYGFKKMPWLLRWVIAGRRRNVERIAPAILELHRLTFDYWQLLLGADHFARLFRRQGQAYAWEVPVDNDRNGLATHLRDQFGLRSEWLSSAEMRDLFPGLSARVQGGLLLPDNGQVVNPGEVVAALADVFRIGGGILLQEQVMRIARKDAGNGQGALIITNCANHKSSAVVIAAGIWTEELLAPLGVWLPIVAERGYHAHLGSPSMQLPMPISMRSRGFALSPMSDGLRAAGTVEIAPHDAPMKLQRAKLLLSHVQQLFPDIRYDEPRFWMGTRPSTPDSLPIIDELPGLPGIFVCAGHGHTGMIGGPGSGQLLVRLMNARRDGADLPVTPYGLQRFKGLSSFLGAARPPRFSKETKVSDEHCRTDHPL